MDKFDYCISNPPYQNIDNKPIFHIFPDVANIICDSAMMIYMGSRWWYGTSGLADYRDNMFLNHNLYSVVYYDEKEVYENIFPHTEIAGGVTIVNVKNNTNNFILLTENKKDKTIKIDRNKSIYPIKSSEYCLAKKISDFVSSHNMGTLYQKGVNVKSLKMTSAQLKELSPREEKPLDEEKYIKYYGTIEGSKGAKSKLYYLNKPEGYISDGKYKVCFSQTVIENNQRKFNVYMLDNNTEYGRSSVCLFASATIEEQENFYSYAKTRFFEKMIRLTLSSRMKYLGYYVPDLKDYTDNNDLFKSDNELGSEHQYYGLDLSHRLYTLFNLTDEEVNLIEGG